MAIIVDVKDHRTAEILLLELKYRLQVGFLSEDPIEEVYYSCHWIFR